MQEMMVEKLKKQADATVVKIKDISYDAGYLHGLDFSSHVLDWKCSLSLPSSAE